MASGTRGLLAVLFAAALSTGAVAQYQPRPAQLPAQGGRISGPPSRETIQMVEPSSSDEDCKRRWQEYQRSQACFAPFRTVNGMKPEAYLACGKELPDPSADCGPPRAQ